VHEEAVYDIILPLNENNSYLNVNNNNTNNLVNNNVLLADTEAVLASINIINNLSDFLPEISLRINELSLLDILIELCSSGLYRSKTVVANSGGYKNNNTSQNNLQNFVPLTFLNINEIVTYKKSFALFNVLNNTEFYEKIMKLIVFNMNCENEKQVEFLFKNQFAKKLPELFINRFLPLLKIFSNQKKGVNDAYFTLRILDLIDNV
jgi:hypothetical protein